MKNNDKYIQNIKLKKCKYLLIGNRRRHFVNAILVHCVCYIYIYIYIYHAPKCMSYHQANGSIYSQSYILLNLYILPIVYEKWILSMKGIKIQINWKTLFWTEIKIYAFYFFESLKFLIENRCPEFNEQFSWKLPKRAFINLLKLPSNNNYIVRTLSQIFSIVYSEMTFNKNSYLWVSEWCLKKKYRRCLLLYLLWLFCMQNLWHSK